MKILLTNDDGYYAEGLLFLKDYFEKRGDHVYVVAPDSEKSGFSHSITLKDTIRLVNHKENLWIIRGTPVDCVNVALLGMVPDTIDMVVSGVNHGPNIGKDIIYSGTVGAARQGALHHKPAIALSSNTWEEPVILDSVSWFLDRYFQKLMDKNDGSFIFNVNFPNIEKSQIKGIRQTSPCHHHFYKDTLIEFDSKTTGVYYWIKGDYPVFGDDEGTDARAVREGYVSVSAIKILPEQYPIDLEL